VFKFQPVTAPILAETHTRNPNQHIKHCKWQNFLKLSQHVRQYCFQQMGAGGKFQTLFSVCWWCKL